MSRPPINAVKNILGMNLYYDQFFAVALDNLRKVLSSVDSVDNIEVELKYAEFRYFAARFDEREWRDRTKGNQNEMMNLRDVASVQSLQYLKGLELLSKQNIINLTPLTRNTYMLAAGFNQQKHKKFYRIRDFLLKMCEYNQRNNYQPRPLDRQEEPPSIYHELSLNGGNHQLRLKEKNQLRCDIYVKEGVTEAIRGRYSYSDKTGWSRTEKEPLCQQIDFMLGERTFRFAINREKESGVPQGALNQISRLLRENPKLTDIRLKRLFRVTKGDILEYSLSEIYNINQQNSNNCPDFAQKIVAEPTELNSFLRKIFVNFYSVKQKNHIKFQIESEFTKNMTQNMRKFISRERLSDVKYELDSAIEELYALFFCDHATKVKQMPWLNAKVKQMPETRLQNEFGDYMRQELYDVMKNRN